MDTSYLRAALVTVLGGGVVLASIGMYQTRQEVQGRIVMMAGSTHYFELAETFREDLERNGVQLVVKRKMDAPRTADKAGETYDALYSLIDPKSDVNASFVKGGLYGSLQGSLVTSDKGKDRRRDFEKLQSVGRLFLEPIWVFTRGDLPITSLRDLKGKKILTGSREGGSRRIALMLLRANGVDKSNADRIEKGLSKSAEELLNGEADAAVLILPADSETIQSLLKVKNIRLMDFSLEAEAYVNRFPALTKVTLRRGAVDFGEPIPTQDITLLTTAATLVVRPEMDAALVSLLTQAVINHPKSGFDRQGDPILFYKAGEFPNGNDTEYQLSKDARLVYKSGELPYMLSLLAPINKRVGLPFTATAFANAHWKFLVPLLAALAVILPAMRGLPVMYEWNVRRRLVYWYRQLKNLERSLDSGGAKYDLPAHQAEIERIDVGVRKLRVPAYYSHQLYDLRGHIDLVRRRLLTRPDQMRMAAE